MQGIDVLNALRNAHSSARDNYHDVRRDDVFTDDEALNEGRVIDALSNIVDVWQDVLPYLTDDGTNGGVVT